MPAPGLSPTTSSTVTRRLYSIDTPHSALAEPVIGLISRKPLIVTSSTIWTTLIERWLCVTPATVTGQPTERSSVMTLPATDSTFAKVQKSGSSTSYEAWPSRRMTSCPAANPAALLTVTAVAVAATSAVRYVSGSAEGLVWNGSGPL